MSYSKKYLVVLAGSPRGGEKTWNSLFKYVVDHLNADLAVCTTNNFVNKNKLFQKAKFHSKTRAFVLANVILNGTKTRQYFSWVI